MSVEFASDIISAGILAASIKCVGAPFRNINDTMNRNHLWYRSYRDCITKIKKDSGIMGFWRGNLSCLGSYVPI